MNNKQTAVEWLAEELLAQFYLQIDSLMAHKLKGKVEQAKAMEKEQIINAHINGQKLVCLEEGSYPNEYYQETYGKS